MSHSIILTIHNQFIRDINSQDGMSIIICTRVKNSLFPNLINAWRLFDKCKI